MDDSGTRVVTKFLIYATIGCAIIALYMNESITAKQGWSLFSIAPIPELMWVLFDRRLWSLKVFSSFMPPNLNGEWNGICKAEHDDEKHDIKLIITQTFSKICIISNSRRVDSPSRTASIERNHGNSWQLVYTWAGTFKSNAPQQGNVLGATFLWIIHGNDELRGEYISCGQRLTKGTISVRKGSKNDF